MENTAPRYSFFQAPIHAFFNKNFYQDVAANWRGTGAFYLFVLLLSCWAISTVCFGVWLHAAFQKNRPLVAQVPKITVTSTNISVDKATPYYIRNPQGQEAYVVFVGSEQDSLNDTDPPAVVTPTKMLLSTQHGVQIVSAKDIFSFYKSLPGNSGDAPLIVDQAGVARLLDFMSVAEPILVFLWLPFLYLMHFLQALLYSLVALIAANTLKKEVPYQTLLRISAVALTPAIVISTILWFALAFDYTLAPDIGRAWNIIAIPLTIFYVVFAMKTVPALSASESVDSNP